MAIRKLSLNFKIREYLPDNFKKLSLTKFSGVSFNIEKVINAQILLADPFPPPTPSASRSK